MAGEIVIGTSGWRYDHWWCFFDNDQAGHAAANAMELAGMVAG
ncbi:MAG TPA: hypothetical protein VLT32_20575 [Candidatus Sulfomarinibacteraceae bacterium]|nr:hypothetical protein [Candidatus Sulfomarinibacteraceae bacterium]